MGCSLSYWAPSISNRQAMGILKSLDDILGMLLSNPHLSCQEIHSTLAAKKAFSAVGDMEKFYGRGLKSRGVRKAKACLGQEGCNLM